MKLVCSRDALAEALDRVCREQRARVAVTGGDGHGRLARSEVDRRDRHRDNGSPTPAVGQDRCPPLPRVRERGSAKNSAGDRR